jgi:hypothetical protein
VLARHQNVLQRSFATSDVDNNPDTALRASYQYAAAALSVQLGEPPFARWGSLKKERSSACFSRIDLKKKSLLASEIGRTLQAL